MIVELPGARRASDAASTRLCLGAAACLPVETIVVDNASDDGSWDEAAGRDPACALRAQRRERRLRRAPATRRRAARSGRHLVFLNFDCEPRARLARRARAAPPTTIPGAGRGAGRRSCTPTARSTPRATALHYLGFSWAPRRRRAARRASGRRSPVALGRVLARAAHALPRGRGLLGGHVPRTARTPTSAGGCAWRATASLVVPGRARAARLRVRAATRVQVLTTSSATAC